MPQLAVGTDFVQLPTDSGGKKVGFYLAPSGLYLPGALLVDSAGNTIDAAAAAPAGTERGLIVRPIPNDASVSGTLTAAGASGNPSTTNTTAGSFIGPITVAGQATATFSIQNTGAAGGNVELQGSLDGTNWVRLGVMVVQGGGNITQNATATATYTMYQALLSGMSQVRLMATTAPSSNITAALRVSTGPALMLLGAGGGTNTLGAVNQQGAWTVQPGNTQNTTPWLTGSLTKRITGASAGLDTAAAYAAGDVMGSEITLTGMARASGGAGVILGVVVESDDATALLAFDIFLFPAASTPAGNNAANAWADATMQTLIGVITVPAGVASGSNQYTQVMNVNLPFVTTTTANLFAVMVTRGAQAAFTTATSIHLAFLVAQD
jgi:hypothetical protein